MRSDAVIPASVPGEVVLIRAEQVAVAVGSVRAYPNGFEFTVQYADGRRAATTGVHYRP